MPVTTYAVLSFHHWFILFVWGTAQTQQEGERENWNLPLVKAVSVVYNNLGWTSPSSVVGNRWWFQMSHVKAPEDTPKKKPNAAVMEGLGLYSNPHIH